MKNSQLKLVAILFSLLFFPMMSAAQPAAPAQNYVLQFSGDDAAVAPQSGLLNLGNQFTMETWVYLNSQTPYAVIMGKVNNPRGSDPYMHYALDLTPDGKLEFVQTTGQPGSYRGAYSASVLPLNQWIHIAATLQGTTMAVYVNGQQAGTGVSAGSPAGTDVPFTLGGGVQSFGGQACCGFNGYLKQSRVWNRALSAAEVLSKASLRMNAGEPGLVAQWMLDDAQGQTAQDSSGNNLLLQLGTLPAADNNDPQWKRAFLLDNGPFFTAESFQVGPTNHGSFGRLMDFDSDSDLDFIEILSNYSQTPGPPLALRNNGQGIFSDATSAVLGSQTVSMHHPRHFAIADFNGDGRKDIFIANHGYDQPPFAGGQSRILIQTADGKLTDETATRLPIKDAFTHHVGSADIDGDGDIDLYLANIGCSCMVRPELYINDGTGHFTVNTSRLPTYLTTDQRRYTTSVFVDLNGDNRPELILGGHPGTASNTASLRDTILMNDGNGNFLNAAPETSMPPRAGGSTWGTMAIEPADFNNDGKVDLLVSVVETDYLNGRVQLLLNNGDGTFRDGSAGIQQPSLPQDGQQNWIVWSFPADFNGDGKMDFVISPNGAEPPHLYLNLGQARFVDASELLPSRQGYSEAYPGDVDRDGDTDIFVTRYGGNYTVLRNQKPFIVGARPFDFDGDGKSDESVYRPADNVWYLNRSQAGYVGYQFGTAGDLLAPADYTGDGKTDVATFRPSAGVWFILKSEDNTFYSANFGASGDVPVPGDFDGDGKADTAVFRASSGYWFLQQSTAGFSAVLFGTNGDVPTLGDFDGDGKTDVGVFRASNGVWYRLNSSNGSFFGAQFGQNGDKVVPADYSGDGKTDLAIWRPSDGTWYIQRSEDNSFYGQQFGTAGDLPSPGDYDGDGKADVSVFRPSSGYWFEQRSTSGFAAIPFGTNGDKPTPNAFVY